MEDKQRYIFIQNTRYLNQANKDLIYFTDEENLDELLQDFEIFLRGCGFYFNENEHIGFVNDKDN